MSLPLHLRAGDLQAALRPDLGGSLAGLWRRGEPVLRSVPAEALERANAGACFPLLPYSNRIGHCHFEWQGQAYRTRPNFNDHPHSLHGVGWQRVWSVDHGGETEAQLSLRHAPDADWPFAFEAQQGFALSPDGLRLTLRLRNTDARPQPAGLGWHPYFLHRPGGRLRAAVQGRWAMGEDHLPVGRQPHAPLDAEVRSLALDHCFDGWDGRAVVDSAGLRLQLTSDLGCLVVYTPAEMPQFCVEPVSHVNNAVQAADPLGQGLVNLAPGAELTAWMHLLIEPMSLP